MVDWAAVEKSLETAAGIAWDGCHKIYVLADSQQVVQMKAYGYGEGDDSRLIEFGEVPNLTLSLDFLKIWYETSCPLKFVERTRTLPGYGDTEFTDLIKQGAEWDDYEEDSW